MCCSLDSSHRLGVCQSVSIRRDSRRSLLGLHEMRRECRHRRTGHDSISGKESCICRSRHIDQAVCTTHGTNQSEQGTDVIADQKATCSASIHSHGAIRHSDIDVLSAGSQAIRRAQPNSHSSDHTACRDVEDNGSSSCTSNMSNILSWNESAALHSIDAMQARLINAKQSETRKSKGRQDKARNDDGTKPNEIRRDETRRR